MEQRGSCRGKGEGGWVSAPGWGEGKMGRNISWKELRKWRVQFGAASSMSWEPSSAALLLGLSSSPMPTTPSGHTGIWDAPSQHPALTHTLVTPKRVPPQHPEIPWAGIWAAAGEDTTQKDSPNLLLDQPSTLGSAQHPSQGEGCSLGRVPRRPALSLWQAQVPVKSSLKTATPSSLGIWLHRHTVHAHISGPCSLRKDQSRPHTYFNYLSSSAPFIEKSNELKLISNLNFPGQ